MSFIDHAKNELNIIGLTEDSSEASDITMRNNILHMIQEFAEECHSGFSASIEFLLMNIQKQIIMITNYILDL